MNFGPWLRKQTHRKDATGDLARDFVADTCRNKGTTYERIRSHLIDFHNPVPNAIFALESAKEEFLGPPRSYRCPRCAYRAPLTLTSAGNNPITAHMNIAHPNAKGSLIWWPSTDPPTHGGQ